MNSNNPILRLSARLGVLVWMSLAGGCPVQVQGPGDTESTQASGAFSDAYMVQTSTSTTTSSTSEDDSAAESTSSYTPDAPYFQLDLVMNGSQSGTVSVVWYAIAVEGVATNSYVYDESQTVDGDATLTFGLKNPSGAQWPAGQYRVEAYLDNTLGASIDFNVVRSE